MPGINMREWLPSPIFLPGEFHGLGAWQTIVLEDAESDMTDTHPDTGLCSNEVMYSNASF